MTEQPISQSEPSLSEPSQGEPSPSKPSTSQRSRGGQPGNTNALKHGFYTHRNPELKVDALEVLDTEFPGFEEEILVLRIYIRRLLEMSGGFYRMEHGLAILRALCQAFSTLARLSREHRCLTANSTPTISVLREARDDIAAVEDPVKVYDNFFTQYMMRYGGKVTPQDVQEAYHHVAYRAYQAMDEIRKYQAKTQAVQEEAQPEQQATSPASIPQAETPLPLDPQMAQAPESSPASPSPSETAPVNTPAASDEIPPTPSPVASPSGQPQDSPKPLDAAQPASDESNAAEAPIPIDLPLPGGSFLQAERAGARGETIFARPPARPSGSSDP